MKGMVFNIQRFSVNDGPGIRTTVFMKGCPLDCLWCHNPESKSFHPELVFESSMCVGCGECFRTCPQVCHGIKDGTHIVDHKRCIGCGECAAKCCGGALSIVGREREAVDVVSEVLKDKPFFENSGGGVTFSGGEPLAQPDFLAEMLRLSKEQGICTAIETSGYASHSVLEKILPFTDIFLFDIKDTNEENHRKYTGVSAETIQENLEYIDRSGKSIILRCPLIPRYNDREEHLHAIAALADLLTNVIRIELEPYHPLGMKKARNIGKEYAIANNRLTDRELAEKWVETVQNKTDVPVTLG